MACVELTIQPKSKPEQPPPKQPDEGTKQPDKGTKQPDRGTETPNKQPDTPTQMPDQIPGRDRVVAAGITEQQLAVGGGVILGTILLSRLI